MNFSIKTNFAVRYNSTKTKSVKTIGRFEYKFSYGLSEIDR